MRSGAYKFQKLVGSMTKNHTADGWCNFCLSLHRDNHFLQPQDDIISILFKHGYNIYHYISSNSQNPNTQNQNSKAWYHKATLKESRRDGGALRGKGGDFLSVFLWLPSPLTEECQKEIYNDDVSFCHSLQGGSARRKSYALRVPKKGRFCEKNRTFVC